MYTNCKNDEKLALKNMNNKKTSLKKMWLNGHLFSDHFLFKQKEERLPVLSCNEDLKKTEIEDIVCNIQNNEEDKSFYRTVSAVY